MSSIDLPPLITGPWKLKDLAQGQIGQPRHGKTVFSCFHCGGGSSMGYKLAGFNVLGGVEIDPEMMKVYRTNHLPKHSYQMPVQEFKDLPTFPDELMNLDVLDGSPPCSSFSMAGSREDAWGEKKKFREGQALQVLDDLFFHFIQVAAKLRPKIVVAENVKGLILGTARGYVKEIFQAFRQAGYETQLFLLNSSRMGVPQSRERTFFIARRMDLTSLPRLKLEFNEPVISAASATEGCPPGKPINPDTQQWRLWHKCKPGDSFAKHHPKQLCFTSSRLRGDWPAPTVTSQIRGHNFHWSEPRNFSREEILRFQSFPDDYDFLKIDPGYICGMSVPPLMMQRVASELARVLLQV